MTHNPSTENVTDECDTDIEQRWPNAVTLAPIADKKYVVKEGIESTWRYHLAQPHKYAALCGRRVMHTDIPVSAWGTKTHLNEKWCDDCRAKGTS